MFFMMFGSIDCLIELDVWFLDGCQRLNLFGIYGGGGGLVGGFVQMLLSFILGCILVLSENPFHKPFLSHLSFVTNFELLKDGAVAYSGTILLIWNAITY